MSRRDRQRRRRRHRAHPVQRTFLIGTLLVISGVAIAALLGVGWVVATADSAPNLSQLTPRHANPPTEIFAGDGSLLGYVRTDTISNYVALEPDPQAPPAGDGRDRGPAFLPARRARLPGDPSRRRQGPVRRAQLPAGRVDADDAARRQLVPRRHGLRQHPQPEVQDHLRPSWPSSSRASTARTGSSRATSTTCRTGPPTASRRSASVPRRSCSSTGRCGSSTSPRCRCWPGCRNHRPSTTRRSTRSSPRTGATRCSRRWFSRTTSRRGSRTRSTKQPLQLHPNARFIAHSQPYIFDYIQQQLDNRFGANDRRARRTQGLHHDQPAAPAGGGGRDPRARRWPSAQCPAGGRARHG